MRVTGAISRRTTGMALAIVLLACSGPTPPPTDRLPDQTDQPTTGTPGPEASPEVATNAGADVLAPVPQPALPGLYLPEGMLARGSDHFAFIQSPTDCQVLTAVLGAGEWSVTDRLEWPTPSPDPQSGVPDMLPPEFLLLRSGSDAAFVRMGGDKDGCVAQVWRLARQPYTASGAIEAAGDAVALQTICFAGAGMAQFGSIYLAPEGVAFSLQSTVPLLVGSHPIGQETELSIGRGQFDVGRLLELFGPPADGTSPLEEISMSEFFPADFESGGWQGSVEVTSIEPLTGEIVFENLRDESGRSQTLSTGFRCDLPPGQLSRAAEASVDASPAPGATPTPAAGEGTITVSSGPHAGTHQIVSQGLTCSANIFGDGKWLVSYSPEDQPAAGEIQSLQLTLPEKGGKTDAFLTFGDDIDSDWLNTSKAAGEVDDQGQSVDFAVSGKSSGVQFDIAITCHDVSRF